MAIIQGVGVLSRLLILVISLSFICPTCYAECPCYWRIYQTQVIWKTDPGFCDESWAVVRHELEHAIGEFIGYDFYEATLMRPKGQGICGRTVGSGCDWPTFEPLFCERTKPYHQCRMKVSSNWPVPNPFPPEGDVAFCYSTDETFTAELAHSECDHDGDGAISRAYLIGDDCDDSDRMRSPYHQEYCNDGFDSDCDPFYLDNEINCVCLFGEASCVGGIWHPEPACYCVDCPIFIDTAGDGIELVSPEMGVPFDLNRDGTAEQLSWTKPGSDDGLLVLDRDQNGIIDNGRELFGNRFFDTAPEGSADGYSALRIFDVAANGGNGDGIISALDSIFSALRVWLDSNHDGIAQTGELTPLGVMGIESIELYHLESRRTDEFGNIFRYRSKVHFSNHKQKYSYDVFLAKLIN